MYAFSLLVHACWCLIHSQLSHVSQVVAYLEKVNFARGILELSTVVLELDETDELRSVRVLLQPGHSTSQQSQSVTTDRFVWSVLEQ